MKTLRENKLEQEIEELKRQIKLFETELKKETELNEYYLNKCNTLKVLLKKMIEDI